MTTPASGTSAGIAVAYSSAWNASSPALKRIDTSPVQSVTGYRTRRGRSLATDAMDMGTATIDFVDTTALLDPTNTSGPFYPMNPNSPMVIRLWNPVTTTWVPIFTGLTQGCSQTRDYQSGVTFGSLDCADFFSMLAIAEVPPGIDYDDMGSPTSNADGDTRFASQNIDDHIKALLTLGGLSSSQWDVFSGNVVSLPIVYPPGTKILAALQDAADAEFPGVAVIYVSKDGLFTFHGRFARFNPSAYSAHTWNVGDLAYVNGGSGRIPIRSMTFDRSIEDVINAALFTPAGIADADIAGQLIDDATSISAYGQRGLTGTDNYTGGGVPAGDGLDSNEECQRFGTYFVDNRKNPVTYAKQITIGWAPATASYASDLWNLLCNIEIGDEVVIHTTHPSSGGFGGLTHFVEGLSYDVKTGVKYTGDAEATADVTLTIDLSPQAYFTTSPPDWS